MKILQISPEGNYGSVGTIAEQIGYLAKSEGHDSYIAIGNYYLPSNSKIYKIRGVIGRYYSVLLTRILDKNALGSSHATRRLIKWIDKLDPDIIHIHQLHGYFININILFNYLSKLDIPIVLTLHDCWNFTGHCTYFDNIACNKWKVECGNCPLLRDYPRSLLRDNSTENFRLKKHLFSSINNLFLVSVSEWLSRKVSDSFLGNIPNKVIYNGVDTRIFNPIQFGKPNPFAFEDYFGKFIILGVASPWNDRKGLSDFIELAKLLDPDDIIVLIGLTKSQISRLPDNIIGLEKIKSRELLAGYYRNSEVFINFSVEETFGLTTVEAMASGTPAIVYNSTACPEIVSEDSGFIVEKRDIASVNKILQMLKSDTTELERYSENCVRRARSLFNSEDRYLDYIRLYSELVK